MAYCKKRGAKKNTSRDIKILITITIITATTTKTVATADQMKKTYWLATTS